jgi:hypothetical protein
VTRRGGERGTRRATACQSLVVIRVSLSPCPLVSLSQLGVPFCSLRDQGVVIFVADQNGLRAAVLGDEIRLAGGLQCGASGSPPPSYSLRVEHRSKDRPPRSLETSEVLRAGNLRVVVQEPAGLAHVGVGVSDVGGGHGLGDPSGFRIADWGFLWRAGPIAPGG